MPKKFDSADAIKFGWNTMKDNLGFFIGLLVWMFVVGLLFTLIEGSAEKNNRIFFVVIQIVDVLVSSLLGLGLIKITLKFCDNETAVFNDIFSQYDRLFNYVLASIVYFVMMAAGFILLVIPGIIIAIRFSQYKYLIIDRGLGPIDALKKSFEITQGATWDLIGFGILVILILIVGTLALFVGLFAAFPTVTVAQAFVYRQLLKNTEIVEQSAPLEMA